MPQKPPSANEATNTIEIERKYDADAATPLPDWSALVLVNDVGAPQERLLDARYFDTAQLTLSRASVALRRRTGGPDEGWHVKGPRVGDGRSETAWPLDAGSAEDPVIPPAALETLLPWTGHLLAASDLRPLARIENTRTAYSLNAAEGMVAEFVDDRVTATDLRTGRRTSWREWEMELGPAAPGNAASRQAFFSAVDTCVFAAGGRLAASDSKLARALGQ